MSERSSVVIGSRLDGSRDRPTQNPGGCDCMWCACVFIGADGDDLCAVCAKDEEATKWLRSLSRSSGGDE